MYLERYRSNVTSLAITKCRTIFLPVKIIKLNFPPEKWALGTILRKLSFTVKQVLISRRLEWEMLQGLGQKTILQSQTSNQYSGPTTLPQLLLDWVYVILTHWGWYPAEHYKYCLKKSSTLLCLACSLLDRDIKFLTVSGLLCPLCQNMLSFQSAKISGLSAFYSQRH